MFVNEDSGVVTINLDGISPGAGESGQTLAISARSSNPDLVPDPAVNYVSPAATGTLTLMPNPGTNGVAIITVSANDGSAVLTRAFNLTVRARPALSFIAEVIIDEDTTSPAISFQASDLETPAQTNSATASLHSRRPMRTISRAAIVSS
jgi:hypothetical protein